VAPLQGFDLSNEMTKIGIASSHDVRDGLSGIDGKAEQFTEHFRLGKADGLGVDATALDGSREELALVFPVEDGKTRIPAQGCGVAAQDAVANGVESSAPEIAEVVENQFRDPLQHFARSLVGEVQQEDVRG